MLKLAVTLVAWLPRIFPWVFAPVVAVAVPLALIRRARPRAALGFMIAAALSASFLSVETAALGYVCCDQARLIFSLLLDVRPGVTASFVTSLLGSLGTPLLGLVPMFAAAICTSLSAVALRGKQDNKRVVPQMTGSTI